MGAHRLWNNTRFVEHTYLVCNLNFLTFILDTFFNLWKYFSPMNVKIFFTLEVHQVYNKCLRDNHSPISHNSNSLRFLCYIVYAMWISLLCLQLLPSKAVDIEGSLHLACSCCASLTVKTWMSTSEYSYCWMLKFEFWVLYLLQMFLTDIFPCHLPYTGQVFPADFQSIIQRINRYFFHLLAHIYHSHFLHLLQFELHCHLNSIFCHYVHFLQEFDMLDPKDTCVLEDLIEVLQLNNEESQPSEPLGETSDSEKERGNINSIDSKAGATPEQ